MVLEKLSSNVNKRANASIKKVIWGLCAIAGLIVLIVVMSNTISSNIKQVKLYRAQVDNTMQEKAAFINTVAAGASSNTVGEYYAYVDEMVAQYDDVSAVYVCVEEDGVIYKDGVMTYMSGGWLPPEEFVVSERGWYQGALSTDGVYVTEPYVDEQSGTMCITLAKKITKGGKVVGVAGLDMYMNDLVSLIESSYDGGDYVFLTTDEGVILTHPNNEISLSAEKSTNVADALNGKYKSVCDQQLSTKLIFDYSGGVKFAISDKSEATGWNVIAVISITWIIIILIIIVAISVVLGILIAKFVQVRLARDITPMFKPLEKLAANVGEISNGNLEYSFEVDMQSQEVNALSVALNDTIHSLQGCIIEISNAVTSISEKNLDFNVEGMYPGDYEKIKVALINIMDVLNESFADINEKAQTVLSYSKDLSSMSENVAQTATDQSSSVMDASEKMNILTKHMEEIASFAVEIKENTDNTNERLTLGNQEMQELVAAMDEISECYNEIAGFVSEINGIANQTSLLALNASIEAARAGEAGRGFAVVAEEIGSLSASSTQSSQKIGEVIGKSLASVEKGKNLAARTEKSIDDSVSISVENTKLVGEIVNFVEEQKASADAISENLREISDMVGSNAASAEENSAISISLGECAQSLIDTIGQFSLK